MDQRGGRIGGEVDQRCGGGRQNWGQIGPAWRRWTAESGAKWTSATAVGGGGPARGWAAEVLLGGLVGGAGPVVGGLLGGLVGRAGPAWATGGWPWRRAGDGRRRNYEMETYLSEL